MVSEAASVEGGSDADATEAAPLRYPRGGRAGADEEDDADDEHGLEEDGGACSSVSVADFVLFRGSRPEGLLRTARGAACFLRSSDGGAGAGAVQGLALMPRSALMKGMRAF